MNDSTNVRIIADNIRKLEKMVKEAGSELPTPGAGDTGKILKVGSDGYELATEYSYTPPAYSDTDEVETGRRWIDGKKIYEKVLITSFGDDGNLSVDVTSLGIDQLISLNGYASHLSNNSIVMANYYSSSTNRFVPSYNTLTKIISCSTASGYAGDSVVFIIEYTKADPVPSEETKKTTKKG